MKKPSQMDTTTTWVYDMAFILLLVLIIIIFFFSAILELNEPVYFNRNVRPICLPRRSVTTNYCYHSSVGSISGWGKTELNEWATNLKEVDVRLFGTNICKKVMHIQGMHAWDSRIPISE